MISGAHRRVWRRTWASVRFCGFMHSNPSSVLILVIKPSLIKYQFSVCTAHFLATNNSFKSNNTKQLRRMSCACEELLLLLCFDGLWCHFLSVPGEVPLDSIQASVYEDKILLKWREPAQTFGIITQFEVNTRTHARTHARTHTHTHSQTSNSLVTTTMP